MPTVAAFSVGTLAYPGQHLTASAVVPVSQRAGVFGTMITLASERPDQIAARMIAYYRQH